MGCCQTLACSGLAVLGHGLGRLVAAAACRRRCRMGGGRLDGRQFCCQLGGATALASTDGCAGVPAVDVAGRPRIRPAGLGLVGLAAGAGGSVSGAGVARCPLVPHTAGRTARAGAKNPAAWPQSAGADPGRWLRPRRRIGRVARRVSGCGTGGHRVEPVIALAVCLALSMGAGAAGRPVGRILGRLRLGLFVSTTRVAGSGD